MRFLSCFIGSDVTTAVPLSPRALFHRFRRARCLDRCVLLVAVAFLFFTDCCSSPFPCIIVRFFSHEGGRGRRGSSPASQRPARPVIIEGDAARGRATKPGLSDRRLFGVAQGRTTPTATMAVAQPSAGSGFGEATCPNSSWLQRLLAVLMHRGWGTEG
ncbi:hypothetical protein BU14_0266s0006 [Porphyra umbilicalis]|uniref:Uncharacterized protein n=1 Tax=Porphyra umbilicalis TaxID=2786 RepID=A0A1X6P1W7_PORUM|nr:hypothetical protein BU14_0266s0006 [Porphyra umbilicalis]|eukprot:OSX74817.1 hypothetical protein BU14_0266s0006 [Porphyra umbilicalis]